MSSAGPFIFCSPLLGEVQKILDYRLPYAFTSADSKNSSSGHVDRGDLTTTVLPDTVCMKDVQYELPNAWEDHSQATDVEA